MIQQSIPLLGIYSEKTKSPKSICIYASCLSLVFYRFQHFNTAHIWLNISLF